MQAHATSSASSAHASALADDERRKLVIDAILVAVTLAGLVSSIALDRLGAADAVVAAVLVVAFVAGGARAAAEAVLELRRGVLDIDLLMVLAALAAAAVGEPRDGAFLLFLFSLAGVLEEYAMGRTKRAVTSLMSMRPDTAVRAIGDRYETVPVDALAVGDLVIVRPGGYVPVDGTVVEGRSAVDQAAITGESVPVDKGPGEAVFAGTVNQHAMLTVRVEKRAEASTLARMIELVTRAQSERAPSQRFSDWFGQRYTIAVLVGSLLALLSFLLLGLPRDAAFYKAATLLVVASPCAIVISVPAAILAALAAAARRGVLFKGGAALEEFGRADTLALDKTGTLTTGKLEVAEVVPVGIDAHELLALAAGVERHSDHPIAACLVAAAERSSAPPTPVTDAVAHPGFGVSCRHEGARVWAGKPALAASFGAEFDDATRRRLEVLMEAGRTAVVVGRGDRVLGVLGVADAPRPEAAETVRELRERGIARIAMVTGDHHRVARAVAEQIGIAAEDVRADLLPEEKVAVVRELRGGEHARRRVAFVGDGINDAAALATADVGVAMGSAGSDAALEAADVALMSDDLRVLIDALDLARRANGIIRQNLAFAIVAIVVMVALTLFASLPLPLGVIGHEGGTLLVVANGLRLLRSSRRAHSVRGGRRRVGPVPVPR